MGGASSGTASGTMLGQMSESARLADPSEDHLVMESKLKIIEILQVGLYFSIY